MHNFARSFGSAIRLRGNVTAALERVSFSNNTIISEPQRDQRYGPDLFVGDRSTAVLRHVTTSDVVPAPEPEPRVGGGGSAAPAPAPAPAPAADPFTPQPPLGGAPVAKRNSQSKVMADGATKVLVYDVAAETTEAAGKQIGTAPDSVLTADDEWYSNIMAVRPPPTERARFRSPRAQHAMSCVAVATVCRGHLQRTYLSAYLQLRL